MLPAAPSQLTSAGQTQQHDMWVILTSLLSSHFCPDLLTMH